MRIHPNLTVTSRPGCRELTLNRILTQSVVVTVKSLRESEAVSRDVSANHLRRHSYIHERLGKWRNFWQTKWKLTWPHCNEICLAFMVKAIEKVVE